MSQASQENNESDQGKMGKVTADVAKETYYHGLLPREDVRLILENNGDFLVRCSELKKKTDRMYILSIMVNNQLDELLAVKNYVINQEPGKFWITDVACDSIPALITHYMSTKTEITDGVKMTRPVGRQYWEFDQNRVRIERKLGEGAFGEVSMASLFFPKSKNKNKPLMVAVKQAKLDKCGKDEIKLFMNEARSMRQLGHQHIVRFYGVCVLSEPLYMVMELVSQGSLDSYLKKNTNLTVANLNEILLQAAWGLEYLHGKPMLHRDIAARNCLYGEGKLKVSDFGLTRPGTVYQMNGKAKVPIRWTAVETLRTYIYTQKTDVWSFGIMAWEIYNFGAEPYPGMTPAEVTVNVQAGYRMTLPTTVGSEIQTLITRCTAENPNDRPMFPDIAVALQRITGTPRPNFVEIARKEAAELLLLTAPDFVKAATQRRRKQASKTHKVNK